MSLSCRELITDYFLAPLAGGAASLAAGAAGAPAGAVPAAAAASPPSAAASFLGFFFRTILATRVLGRPKGLRPSGYLPSSSILVIRSARVSTHRLRAIPPLRLRLLSMLMFDRVSGV